MTLKYQDLETKIKRFFKAHGVEPFSSQAMPFNTTVHVSTNNQQGYCLVVIENPKSYHDKYSIKIENKNLDCLFMIGTPTIEEAIMAANVFIDRYKGEN